MAGPGDLYQSVILDHARNPRNCFVLETPSRVANGYNPLCGDRCTVYVQLDDRRIQQVSFEHEGCAISTASASIMTEAAAGKTPDEALKLLDELHQVLSGGSVPSDCDDASQPFYALAGVREYPMRVKCALLAWKTLQAALNGQQETITTE